MSGQPGALVIQTYQKSFCKRDEETREERTQYLREERVGKITVFQ